MPGLALFDGEKSGNLHFLLLDFGGFALLSTKVKQAGTAHSTATDHFNLVDGGGEDRKNPLYTDAVGNFANGEGFSIAVRIAALNHHTLKLLDTLLVSFLDFYMHIDSIAGSECGHSGSFFCHFCFYKFDQL